MVLIDRIAKLNTRITFQEPTLVTNAGAFQEPTYANIATVPTVWAQVVYDHGQELTQAEAYTTTQGATVTIRYRSDILSTWQVTMAGENWKIVSPPENVQNLNRWVQFRIEKVKGSI